MASQELADAMELTAELFKTRQKPQDWGRNLIEGSIGLKTERDWTLFYSFIFNPGDFDANAEIETIDPNEQIEGYPPELTVEERRNGTETIIHVKRVVEDEKTED